MKTYILIIMLVIAAAMGGVIGETIGRSGTAEARAQANKAQAQAEESIAMTERCQVLAKDCQTSWYQALDAAESMMYIIDMLTDMVWNYTPEQLNEVRKTQKPDNLTTGPNDLQAPGDLDLNGNIPLGNGPHDLQAPGDL